MKGYTVVTEKFEGPLDLLLHLINKDKLDIYDIPISSVTEQYLLYISTMQEFDIELASEFLVMAAILLQIKSRMLLPKQVSEDEEVLEEEKDPRQQLIERLTTYRQFKLMGDYFSELWDKNQDIYIRMPYISEEKPEIVYNLKVELLLAVLSDMLSNVEAPPTYIYSDDFNVHDKMADIMSLLSTAKSLDLKDTLIRSGSSSELVAAFLAILELMRTGQIKIIQEEKFGSIYIHKTAA